MLSYQDGRTLFRLLCVAIAAGIAIDFGVAVAAIVSGAVVTAFGASAVGTGALAAFYPIAKKLMEQEFLTREILPFSRLHQNASERNALLDRAGGQQDPFAARQSLVARTLQLAEETLRGWRSGTHFELCVFVDADQPLLFSYFDTNRDVTARSMAERARNPLYYLEKNYEVTKLLRKPTSHPRIISDTYDKTTDYAFTTPQQRKQVRSTLLLCIDKVTPCALVITSDEKDAFREGDEKLLFFVRYIAELVRFDLFEGAFIQQVRALRPDLFPPLIAGPEAPRLTHEPELRQLAPPPAEEHAPATLPT